ncbi:hypothetical protein ACWD6P_07470 [Streptomyces sp. NPDC002446]
MKSRILATAVAGTALLLPLAVAGTAQAAPAVTKASVEWGGVFTHPKHAATLRAERSSASASVGTIAKNSERKCARSDCQLKTGSSYTCWSGGPQGKTWVAVLNAQNRLGWVAARCVTIQRIE